MGAPGSGHGLAMDAHLAGAFFKRVCIFGDPVPGVREGSTRTPTLCESEPTLLLVVLVGGVLLAAIAFMTASIATRRRSNDAHTRAQLPPPGEQASVQQHRDRSWRDVYSRLLGYVDRSMADVARMMPDELSLPAKPVRIDNEEGSRLAAEVSVLGSSDVHTAYTAWAQALFRFYLLARDVADAWAQNLPEEQYEPDVKELRRTRAAVIDLADALRGRIANELRS